MVKSKQLFKYSIILLTPCLPTARYFKLTAESENTKKLDAKAKQMLSKSTNVAAKCEDTHTYTTRQKLHLSSGCDKLLVTLR